MPLGTPGLGSSGLGSSGLGASGLSYGASTIIFDLPLQSTLVPAYSAGSPTATFTRASTGFDSDFENLLKLCLSGEPRFTGARRVYNELAGVNTDILSGYGVTGTATDVGTASIAGPDGSTVTVREVSWGATAGSLFYLGIIDFGATNVRVLSVWARAKTGTTSIRICPSNTRSADVPLTTTWQRISALEVGNGSTCGFSNNVAGDAGNVYFYKAMSERVQGQSNQNPSEYVSGGVLSAPYHGAGVDCVKYFTTLNGNTVASNVVTEVTGAAINSTTSKFGVLPGVAGSYYSTPSAAGLLLTGDMSIVQKINSTATPSGATGVLQYKFNGGAGGWAFLISTGALGYVSPGTNPINVSSSSVLPASIPANTDFWVKVTCDADNGAGGSDVKFYTSLDGVTFTQLGTTQTTAGVHVRATNSDPVTVGMHGNGSSFPFSGRVYRSQTYSDITGATQVLDFNPNTFASGTTWVSATTGETWTINGNAKVFGGSGAASIPATWDSLGPIGYKWEPQRINIALWSQQIDHSPEWFPDAGGLTVTANTAVAPDGTTTADTISTVAGVVNHRVFQSITGTAVPYAISVYAKAGTASWLGMFSSGAPSTDGAYFNLATGAIGFTAGGITARIEALPNGWYRCTIVRTLTAAAYFPGFVPNTADAQAANYLAAGTENVLVWGAQVEIGSAASSYIPTTTVAVTRNLDALTPVRSGNLDATIGTLSFEFQLDVIGLTTQLVCSDGSGGGPLEDGNGSGNRVDSFDGTSFVTAPAGSSYIGVMRKAAVAWGGATRYVTNTGSAGSAGAFDGAFSTTGSNFGLGCTSTGSNSNAATGNMRFLNIYSDRKSDAATQALVA